MDVRAFLMEAFKIADAAEQLAAKLTGVLALQLSGDLITLSSRDYRTGQFAPRTREARTASAGNGHERFAAAIRDPLTEPRSVIERAIEMLLGYFEEIHSTLTVLVEFESKMFQQARFHARQGHRPILARVSYKLRAMFGRSVASGAGLDS